MFLVWTALFKCKKRNCFLCVSTWLVYLRRWRPTLTFMFADISSSQIFILFSSPDLEDPDLRGGAARCGGVHVEHVPEGAESQPRAARVCPLQPPSHSQQGPTSCYFSNSHSKLTVLKATFWLTHVLSYVVTPTAFPLGWWKQISLPQPTFERPSRWLWGSRWVNTQSSRPPNWHRDQSSSLSICYWTTPHSQFTLDLCSIYLPLCSRHRAPETTVYLCWTIKQNVC